MILFFLFLFSLPAQAALYEVPVAEEGLKPYAIFTLPNFSSSQGEKFEVSYDMPMELVGEKMTVKFAGPIVDGVLPKVLKGSHGEMTCLEGLEFRCEVSYYGLSIDFSAVLAYVDSLDLPMEQFQGILQVAARFGGDQVGIVSFRRE